MKVHLKTFGQSMAPFFRDGDVLHINSIAFSQIRINDFITFKQNNHNNFITHRVVYKSKSYLITKGDNNLSSDGKIYPRDIVGKVEGIERKRKHVNIEDLYLLQSTLYFDQIVNVKRALEKKNITFLFLKGLPLHMYFEKSHPKRFYADCDVLVKKEDYTQADVVFRTLGYKTNEGAFSKMHAKLKDKKTEISYVKNVHQFPIHFDVHLEAVFLMNQLGKLNALYTQHNIEKLTELFLQGKKRVQIHNEWYPILSLENFVLYLALHLFHHNFKGYYRYDFLDKVIRSSQVNFLLLHEMISSFKLENFVYPTFVLLKKYYKTPFSGEFLRMIRPKHEVLQYINATLVSSNIFEDQLRIAAGVVRFKNIFFLSPNPRYQKLLIFLNLTVLYSLWWVLQKKLLRNYNLFLHKFFGKFGYI